MPPVFNQVAKKVQGHMKLHADKPRYRRRKADRHEGWEKTIDALAMTLCPTEEWQEYEQRVQQLAWKANARQQTRTVRVFPIWRKYRQQALRIATLHRTVPVLRHLPLKVSCFLGDILFK